MVLRISCLVAALALSVATVATPLKPKGIEWSSCSELNNNMTTLVEASTTKPTIFECGKLSVPLDYTDPDSEFLQLQLFRVQATRKPILGTILFNPGGPGGTAAEAMPIIASDLKASVGEQHHLVSWDPRGTGNTIPFICPEAAGQTDASSQSKRDIDALVSTNLTEYFMSGGWESAGTIADVCQASNNKTGSLIGTVSTTRDMLEIVDAIGEDGLLRFYGLSYGTVLGHYFATLFPERVERMLLDGTVEPDAYRQGHYGDNIKDADSAVDGFFSACAENKEECLLAGYLKANCTQDIYNALNTIFEPAIGEGADDDAVAALVLFRSRLFTGLYDPSIWPIADSTLVDLLNATSEKSDRATEATPWSYGQAIGAEYGIRGADATFKPDSAEAYLPKVHLQANVSSFSDIWYLNSWPIAQWEMPANERIFQNFTAKTKHPILYVNGKYDPVTPLSMAKAASKGFEGSVVLAHGGYGHTEMAHPSSCVQDHVQAYFKEGKLPKHDTFCEPDLGIYELSKARDSKPRGAL